MVRADVVGRIREYWAFRLKLKKSNSRESGVSSWGEEALVATRGWPLEGAILASLFSYSSRGLTRSPAETRNCCDMFIFAIVYA